MIISSGFFGSFLEAGINSEIEGGRLLPLLCHKCNASGLTCDLYSHSIASVVTKQTAALGGCNTQRGLTINME